MTQARDRDALDRRALLATGGTIGLSALVAGCDSDRARSPSAVVDEHGARSDLFAHVRDESASVAPITAPERTERRARAGRILRDHGVDALLVEPGATMTYLTGMSWGRSERLFALVALADGSHLWICPAFEESKARLALDAPDGAGGTVVTWNEDEHPYAPLAAALREKRVERIATEPQVRCGFVDNLATVFGRERIVPGHALVLALRARKDAHEIAILRRANELTKRAIDAVAATVEPGLRGAEIAARLDHVHEKLGMRSPWCLALVGPAAALPHGDAAAAPLARGDVLLIDTGAALHGYQSDVSRTWTVGAPPSEEVARVWHVVRDAQRAAFDAIRPAAVAKTVDQAARAHITAAGFGPGYRTFTHRLGHGIGLEGHEDPYFDGGSDVVLASGMTLSNEPGIYLPGRFGVRIEDIVLVTEQGADVLGTWQAGPESPA